jgi:hypothetical protein
MQPSVDYSYGCASGNFHINDMPYYYDTLQQVRFLFIMPAIATIALQYPFHPSMSPDMFSDYESLYYPSESNFYYMPVQSEKRGRRKRSVSGNYEGKDDLTRFLCRQRIAIV